MAPRPLESLVFFVKIEPITEISNRSNGAPSMRPKDFRKEPAQFFRWHKGSMSPCQAAGIPGLSLHETAVIMCNGSGGISCSGADPTLEGFYVWALLGFEIVTNSHVVCLGHCGTEGGPLTHGYASTWRKMLRPENLNIATNPIVPAHQTARPLVGSLAAMIGLAALSGPRKDLSRILTQGFQTGEDNQRFWAHPSSSSPQGPRNGYVVRIFTFNNPQATLGSTTDEIDRIRRGAEPYGPIFHR